MGRRARVNGSSSPSGRGLERFEVWARGSLRACELWRFGAGLPWQASRVSKITAGKLPARSCCVALSE